MGNMAWKYWGIALVLAAALWAGGRHSVDGQRGDVTPDSAYYMSAARSLAAGRGSWLTRWQVRPSRLHISPALVRGACCAGRPWDGSAYGRPLARRTDAGGERVARRLACLSAHGG
jgi:hypothetical protein